MRDGGLVMAGKKAHTGQGTIPHKEKGITLSCCKHRKSLSATVPQICILPPAGGRFFLFVVKDVVMTKRRKINSRKK